MVSLELQLHGPQPKCGYHVHDETSSATQMTRVRRAQQAPK